MKTIFLLGILISSHVFAASSCFLYEVKGVARINGADMHLIVNEKTMSEYKLEVKTSDAHKFAPYLDGTTVGTYVFKGKPSAKSVIQAVQKVTRSTPDPLNHQMHNYIKEVKAVKCPK